MQVKVLKRYIDIERSEAMDPGRVFETTEDRVKKLTGLGLVEVYTEEPEESKPAPKKTTRKKKAE